MSERLCVASYGEDVSWVARTGIEAVIYDATGSRPGLVPVPNEARETSQYLRHIVAHYGAFRDHELFLQGNPFAHQPAILPMLRRRLWATKRFMVLGSRVLNFDPLNQHPHTGDAMSLAEELGITLTKQSLWTVGAMFAVSREALMSYPLPWWRRLLARVIIEREVSPWAMERLWLELFRPVDSPPEA